MASYTKQVPVTAENDYFVSERLWTGCGSNEYFTPSRLSSLIYISYGASPPIYSGNPGIIYPDHRGDFYADTSEIPTGKKITKVEFYIYARYSHSIPLDANGQTLSLKSGWNVITANSKSITIRQLQSYGGCHNATHAEINSHLASTNKPYAIVTYEDVPPGLPSSLYPNNTTLNSRNIIKFSWVHRSSEGLKQKGFTLQYSINDGTSWTTVTQTTPNQYYDLPAGTLPVTGAILWRVKTVDGNSLESTYASGKFNTAIVPQKAPNPLSPLTGYLDGSNSIKFEWGFMGGTAEDKQSKYDLQYSLNKGASWTTISNTSSNEYHILPGYTFQSGDIYWRVRTYNNYGDVSPYSEIGSFHVISSPPIPQITDITNSSKPKITWISSEQQVYEVEILKNNDVILKLDPIPNASDRSYTLEEYLNDGEYLARLRVMNEYNLYSPWAEKSFVISTTKPTKPIIEIFSEGYGVVIKANNTSLKTFVYRDDKLIGELENNYYFMDYSGENNKDYKYFIRVIDNNNNFNDSDTKLARCRFRNNTLAVVDNLAGFIKLKYNLNSVPKKTNRIGNVGNLVYFDGRENPVAEFTEFKEYSKTLSFSFKRKEQLEELIRLIDKKQTLLYRDVDGENIYGVIFNIDFEKDMFGYNVDFTITKTSDGYD